MRALLDVNVLIAMLDTDHVRRPRSSSASARRRGRNITSSGTMT